MRILITSITLFLAACHEVPVPCRPDMSAPADMAYAAPDLAATPDIGGMSDMGCADGAVDLSNLVPRCPVE